MMISGKARNYWGGSILWMTCSTPCKICPSQSYLVKAGIFGHPEYFIETVGGENCFQRLWLIGL